LEKEGNVEEKLLPQGWRRKEMLKRSCYCKVGEGRKCWGEAVTARLVISVKVVSNTWPFFQNRVKKWWALSLQTWGKNEFLAKWYSVPSEKVSNSGPLFFSPSVEYVSSSRWPLHQFYRATFPPPFGWESPNQFNQCSCSGNIQASLRTIPASLF
jgi:hypothetical protein